MSFPQRGLTRTAMLNLQGDVKAAPPDTAHAAWWDSGRDQLKLAPTSGRKASSETFDKSRS